MTDGLGTRMPASRPTSPVDIAAFDVVGTDSDTQPGFVRHVALAVVAMGGCPAGGPVPASHMQPPLDVAGVVPLHTHGTVPLANEEKERLHRFVKNLDLEFAGRRTQYCVRPHAEPSRVADGTVRYTRFSCVGFVIVAYREVELDVIRTDDDSLPSVSLDTLLLAYPDLRRELTSVAARRRAGLPGDGPWLVLLPGHLLTALARDEVSIRSGPPYRAGPGDEYFPPIRSESESPTTAPPAR